MTVHDLSQICSLVCETAPHVCVCVCVCVCVWAPEGKLDFVLSEMNVIIDREHSLSLNVAKGKEAVVKAIAPVCHHLGGGGGGEQIDNY